MQEAALGVLLQLMAIERIVILGQQRREPGLMSLAIAAFMLSKGQRLQA
jgi:hypothetical protein